MDRKSSISSEPSPSYSLLACTFPDLEQCAERGKFIAGSTVSSEFQKFIKTNIERYLGLLKRCLEKVESYEDASVLSGAGGIALLCLHMSKRRGSGGLLSDALHIIQRCLPSLHDDVISSESPEVGLLSGFTGVMAVASIIHLRLRNENKVQYFVDYMLMNYPYVTLLDIGVNDDLLTGRAGYLLLMRFVNESFGKEVFSGMMFQTVVATIFNSGASTAAKAPSPLPLLFESKGQYFTGLGYGIAGVLLILLQNFRYITDQDIASKVRRSIDFILSLHQETGHYPIRIFDTARISTGWLLGSSGIAQMAIAAFRVFKSSDYLDAAVRIGETIWKDGVADDIYISNGTAGQAYVFLALFQTTGDSKYLYRACRFAEWIMMRCSSLKIADDIEVNPSLKDLSLFEGLAGIIYYLNDMLYPLHAKIPCL